MRLPSFLSPFTRERLERAHPLKGLSDNPAYQWWRDPKIIQPHSWWARARDGASLEAEVATMRDLGVEMFRFEVPWRELAPLRPGRDRYDGKAAADPGWPGYRWGRLDLILDVLEVESIAPLPVITHAPAWTTDQTPANPASPPDQPELFGDLMTAMAVRYRDRVHHWELWNEPDHAHSWSGSLRDYVRLILEPGSTAIRAAAPKATILVGGVADYRNLPLIHAAGGSGLYDVASIHAYPRRPSTRPVARAVSQTRALREEVWLTECGIASRAPSIPSPFGGVTSEQGQARFVRSLFESVHADAVFVYQLHDTAILNAGGRRLKEVFWGLVDESGQRRKPAFEAYRQAPVKRRSRALGSDSRKRSALPTAG
ncbi:MAG: cellulase family glycosylhydrolase [Candidatus Dormibacteraceae bacterium]